MRCDVRRAPRQLDAGGAPKQRPRLPGAEGRIPRIALALALFCLATTSPHAETMAAALSAAYTDNPDLNAARAQLRAIDEDVPIALSGYRPTVSATIDVGTETTRNSYFGLPLSDWSKGRVPRAYTLSVEQPIFLGFRTANGVKMAQSSVKAGREQLKVVEAGILLDAVTAFMDVVRAQVVVNLTTQNIEFLREQLRAAQDRLTVGEGTRTDVAQTDAQLQEGLSDYAQALADLNSAIATYVQVIGHRPETLGGYAGVEPMLPKSREAGLDHALASHPSVVAALYNIDVAAYNVRIAEGATLPTLGVTGSLSREQDQSTRDVTSDTAAVTARLTVPIYQAGEAAASVRQYKETLGQRRIDLDSTRAEVRQAFVAAWGELDAARAQVVSATAQVAAQQLVLSGTIEERRVGQRTTLDVLDAQQDLLEARVALVNAQYRRVVGAYTLLSAYGALDAKTLRLEVNVYDPAAHLDAVHDKWGGLRTPDGR